MAELPLTPENIEAAKENLEYICARTAYSVMYSDDNSFKLSGFSKAFVHVDDDIENEVVIAEARIFSFLYGYVSDQALFFMGDEESGELMNLVIAINHMRDMNSRFFDEDIDCHMRGFLIEQFRVAKPFRGLGIGRTAARKMLISAGAPGHPVFAEPGVIGDDGPGLEVVDRFWMKLEPNMRIYDNKESSLRILYSPEFPTDLG